MTHTLTVPYRVDYQLLQAIGYHPHEVAGFKTYYVWGSDRFACRWIGSNGKTYSHDLDDPHPSDENLEILKVKMMWSTC